MPRLLKRPEAEVTLTKFGGISLRTVHITRTGYLIVFKKVVWHWLTSRKWALAANGLKVGLRSQPVGNYLIFYFPLEDGIDIVRVLHGSRDIESLL